MHFALMFDFECPYCLSFYYFSPSGRVVLGDVVNKTQSKPNWWVRVHHTTHGVSPLRLCFRRRPITTNFCPGLAVTETPRGTSPAQADVGWQSGFSIWYYK